MKIIIINIIIVILLQIFLIFMQLENISYLKCSNLGGFQLKPFGDCISETFGAKIIKP